MIAGQTQAEIEAMDSRVRLFLEKETGFSLTSFPSDGIEIRQSPARSDEPRNRMKIYRIGTAALATGIPRAIEAISPVVASMDLWELFSPLGLAEIRRAIGPADSEKLSNGFDYTMTDKGNLRLPGMPDVTQRLPELPDALPGEASLPLPACRGKSIDAFAVCHEGERASVSGIICASPGIVEIAVDTQERYRGRGYALAVVALATQWVLEQGAVAHYGAFTSNVASLRIARRLGFDLAWQTIGA